MTRTKTYNNTNRDENKQRDEIELRWTKSGQLAEQGWLGVGKAVRKRAQCHHYLLTNWTLWSFDWKWMIKQQCYIHPRWPFWCTFAAWWKFVLTLLSSWKKGWNSWTLDQDRMLPQCFKSRSDSNPGLNYDDAHNTEKNAVDIPNEFLKNTRVLKGPRSFLLPYGE